MFLYIKEMTQFEEVREKIKNAQAERNREFNKKEKRINV
jgi:hypothetical protein